MTTASAGTTPTSTPPAATAPVCGADYLERISRLYFADPSRRLRLNRGDRLLTQGMPNERLYRVISGECIGGTFVENILGEREKLELFRVAPGGFIGVHSFFAASGLASVTVLADSDLVELAWIERNTPALEPEIHGNLKEQFFPIVLAEMDKRQLNFHRAAREREDYIKRLHATEAMVSLGQFAAGLAHELNNATGVIMSASDHLCGILEEFFHTYAPELGPWFAQGRSSTLSLSSAEVRAAARGLAKEAVLEYEAAKDIVRMTGGAPPETTMSDCLKARPAWKAGKSCRDLIMAGRHAADIIHSIKQLSAGGHAPRTLVSIDESVREALNLLRNAAQQTEVLIGIAPGLPAVSANKSELMQIWANLIKNALEALRDARTPNPRITVSADMLEGSLCVTVANNGPPVPETLRGRLFQPNITTKHGAGSSMGLGLGLSITKRLVESHNGSIRLEEDDGETRFVVCLPCPECAPQHDADPLPGQAAGAVANEE